MYVIFGIPPGYSVFRENMAMLTNVTLPQQKITCIRATSMPWRRGGLVVSSQLESIRVARSNPAKVGVGWVRDRIIQIQDL
jgi:hypothetical protein